MRSYHDPTLTPTRYKRDGISLYVPGSVVTQRFIFPAKLRLRVSSANRGAAEVAEEIRAVYPSLVVEGNSSLTRKRTAATVQRSWSMAISTSRARSREPASPGREDLQSEHVLPQAASDESAPDGGAQASSTEAVLLLYLTKDTFVDRHGAGLAEQVVACPAIP
jgi:hypothetical protein